MNFILYKKIFIFNLNNDKIIIRKKIKILEFD